MFIIRFLFLLSLFANWHPQVMALEVSSKQTISLDHESEEEQEEQEENEELAA